MPTVGELVGTAIFDLDASGGTSRKNLDSFIKLTGAGRPKSQRPPNPKTMVKRLSRHTGISLQSFDCCINSCFCFVNSDLTHCPKPGCGHPRWKQTGNSNDPRNKDGSLQKIPYKTFDYLPLIPRIKLQFSDRKRAKVLMAYRSKVEAWAENNPTKTQDYWSGALHADLKKNKGMFSSPTDQAYIFSTDGFRVFRHRKLFTSWPLLLVPLNISPQHRHKRRNLLPVGFIPGPKAPDNIHSFLKPLVDEFLLLERGIENVYNAYSNQTFTLHGYITLVSADMPAQDKLMNAYGSSGSRYCAYCYAHGVYKNHVYCPFTPPNDPPSTATKKDKWETYHPRKMPLRCDNDWREDATHITTTIDTTWADELGFNGTCEFMRLQSIDFPRSFGIDPMHLFYENLIPNLFNHMRGKFFPITPPATSNELTDPDPKILDSISPKPGVNSGKKPHPKRSTNNILSDEDEESSSQSSSDSSSENDVDPEPPRRAPVPRRQRKTPGIITSGAATNRKSKATKPIRKDPQPNARRPAKFIQTDDPYCIGPKVWEQIGKDMENSKPTYPAQFGDPLSSITARCHQYKAHEWSQWAHTLSLIYLKGILPEPYYSEYCKLIEALTQCAAAEIHDKHIDDIRGIYFTPPPQHTKLGIYLLTLILLPETMAKFIEHYELHYYRFKWSRLSAMRSTIHMLSHVADGIQWAGPMYVYSQWTMERFCGTAGRMVI